jgi:hypothetical protein
MLTHTNLYSFKTGFISVHLSSNSTTVSSQNRNIPWVDQIGVLFARAKRNTAGDN